MVEASHDDGSVAACDFDPYQLIIGVILLGVADGGF